MKTVRFDRPKLLYRTLGGALLMVVCLALLPFAILLPEVVVLTWLYDDDGRSDLPFSHGCYLALLGLGNVTRFFVGGAAIKLTNTHLIDRSSVFSGGAIAWTQIRQAELVDACAHDGISIFIEAPDEFVRSKSIFKRWLLRLNLGIYATPLHIATDCLTESRENVYESICEYIDTHKPSDSVAQPMEAYLVPYRENVAPKPTGAACSTPAATPPTFQ